MNKIIIEQVAKHRKEAETLVRAFYDHPEISMEETASSRAIVDALAPYGFTIEYPFMEKELGYDTAFRATLKRGEDPKCSIMVEYDALPGIGHGCGHNLHGPLSVLAGIVLSELPEDAFHGTLEVIGTPAEETVGAKLIFAKEGVFDGDALAIMMHSTSGGISRTNTQANALRAYEITFTGKTAHAAGDPWDGHNALTALRKFLDLVDARRDSFHPFTIASGIITEGGKAPNVVPDRAALRFEFRYPVKREIERLDQIVKNCAKGAALALDCSVEFTLAGPDFDDMVRVPLLEEKIKELFTSYGEPVGDPLPPGGSTDAGNVSYRCPTLHAYISISDKACPGHSTALRDATITPHALDQMAKGAAVIAEMVLTVFNDAGYRVAVQKEFEQSVTGKEG